MPYTAPILFFGDMIGHSPDQPTNIGNPGDPNFGMQVTNVSALGTSSDVFRLVWYANQNPTAETFGNGQWWRIERYDPAADDDNDPATGEGGWGEVAFNALDPKPDLVSGMGAGDDYIVFQNQGSGGGHLIVDINASFTTTPQTVVKGPTPGELTFTEAEGAYCFAAGTLLETADGPRPIESLEVGDLVMTRDNGLQPVRWKGTRHMAGALRLNPKLRPIRIRAGALGEGVPAADLVVSPQHRLLVRSRIAVKMFGAMEVLVAAKQLLSLEGVDIAEDLAEVTYVHVLFDRHEVVIANGAEAESLYTGAEALKVVGPAAREEIFAIFPELREGAESVAAARVMPSGRRARKLAMRHLQNGQPLVA